MLSEISTIPCYKILNSLSRILFIIIFYLLILTNSLEAYTLENYDDNLSRELKNSRFHRNLDCQLEINRTCFFPSSVRFEKGKTYNVSYKLSSIKEEHKAVRISVISPGAIHTYPVLFVVKQQLGILSWQLPLQLDNLYNFYEVNRTLCPVINYQEAENISEHQEIAIDISTYSLADVDVSVIVTFVSNFFIQLHEERRVFVTPSQPQYFEIVFPNNTNILVLSVTSPDSLCAIVSIQPIECPVFDMDKNVEFIGYYQTMTKQAAFTIKKKDFKWEKFYVVLVVKTSDYDCSGIGEIKKGPFVANRTKQFSLIVTPKITEQEYLTATIGAVVIFLLFYVFSIVAALIFYISKRKSSSHSTLSSMDGSIQQPLANRTEASYGTITASQLKSSRHKSIKKPSNLKEGSPSASDSPFEDDESSVDEDDVDMLSDADSDKNVLRTKTFLYVADLARKDAKFLSRKSKLYLWNIFTVAVFYALPVVQLVITYESVSRVTGNQDICYYNFLCTYPVHTITDFNHVYSNIGYLMLGFLFIGLVWRRDLIHQQRMALDDHYEKYYGIPRHFGLFYAMGTALMMEGILSGCYHVCPNYSNFQFDTSFMYLIAGLCMLKIYQTRHPDINANAHAAFVAFAVVIFIGVVGVVYGTPYFWIAFAIFHILSCLALSAQIYYMGLWKLNLGLFKRIYLTMKTDLLSETHCFKPMYMDRMLLLLVVNAVNWTFAINGLINSPQNFASYLLAIFIVNLLMYVAFYIIMKIRSKEKILLLPLFYIIMSCITWGAALYFFMQKTTTWELTPARSRLYNKPCLILNFYDDHDIWHFLSAASMFFSFMILLTLDDDLVHTPRDRIAVF